MFFKRLDILAQLAIPIIAITVIFTKKGLNGFLIGVLIFFAGLAVWQLYSMIMHLSFKHWIRLTKTRRVYYMLLVIAIPLCILPVLVTKSVMGIQVAVTVGTGMAVFYFVITVREFLIMRKELKNSPLKENNHAHTEDN